MYTGERNRPSDFVQSDLRHYGYTLKERDNMSNSREWSQRHIEELIKKNGGSGSGSDNCLIIPGAPYVNNFYFHYVSTGGSVQANHNNAMAHELGSCFTKLQINSDVKLNYSFLPVNCKVPVKIANGVQEITAYVVNDTGFNYGFSPLYYKVQRIVPIIEGRDPILDMLTPYVEMRLAFLTDDVDTYIGYYPSTEYTTNVVTLSTSGQQSKFLTLINYVRDITIPSSCDFKFIVSNTNKGYQYDIRTYRDSIKDLYGLTYSRARFGWLSQNATRHILQLYPELRYITTSDYWVDCYGYQCASGITPEGNQLPHGGKVNGLSFYC